MKFVARPWSNVTTGGVPASKEVARSISLRNTANSTQPTREHVFALARTHGGGLTGSGPAAFPRLCVFSACTCAMRRRAGAALRLALSQLDRANFFPLSRKTTRLDARLDLDPRPLTHILKCARAWIESATCHWPRSSSRRASIFIDRLTPQGRHGR